MACPHKAQHNAPHIRLQPALAQPVFVIAGDPGNKRTKPRTVVLVEIRKIEFFRVWVVMNNWHICNHLSQLLSVVVATSVISQRFRLGERRSV